MEVVGGRPGDGDEIEAVLRRYFGSIREPVSDVTIGKLHDVAALFEAEADKIPWALVDVERRVKRVGAATIDGDRATADLSATQAPTTGPAVMVPSSQLVRFEGPMTLVRSEGRWKLADFYSDGVLATQRIAYLRGAKTSKGITVEPLLIRSHRRLWVVHLRIRNDREGPIWFGDAAAVRIATGCRAGSAGRWVVVPAGGEETTAFSWSGRVRPFGSTVRLLIPLFDMTRRRWVRLIVAGRVDDGAAP